MKEKSRILVVDDEIVVCKSVHKILTQEEHVVDYTLDALGALRKLKRGRFDVVITDLMMPLMSGMELLESIKKEWPEIQVIMITGYATFKTAVQAIKLGAFDYIPKPFTPEELSAVTARALERQKLDLDRKIDEMKQEEAAEAIEEDGEISTAEITVEPRKEFEAFTIPEHSWAKIESDGMVRIGMDDIFQKTVGIMVNIDLPFEEDEIEQGQACARITGKGMRLYTLWSPISGRVVEVNNKCIKDCSLASKDPYGKGWLVRIKPTNLEEDLKNLRPQRIISSNGTSFDGVKDPGSASQDGNVAHDDQPKSE